MASAIPLHDEGAATNEVTVYCVQAYWRDREKLARGRFRQFAKEEAAIGAGKAAAIRNAGVVVFSVSGHPEADYWEEPVVIATFGDVPRAD